MNKLVRLQTCIALLWLNKARAQIRTSNQLNCNFEEDCRWQNATYQPPAIGWVMTNDIIPDDRFPLKMTKDDDGNSFAYSYGPPGYHSIELVSDIIDCQLGGARLSFWYFYSGPRSSLDVCSRWPPGSTDPAHRHCYEPAATPARAQQWTFASVELPPASQSMEIVIRARFEAPKDVVALDDIKYEAILCENTHRLGSQTGAGGDIGDFGPGQAPDQVRQIPTQNGLRTLDMRSNSLDADAEVLRPPASPFKESADFDYDGPPGSTAREVDGDSGPMALLTRIDHSNCGVNCDFDGNDLCNFTVPNVASHNEMTSASEREKQGVWTLTKDAMHNPITGIKQDLSKNGYFLTTDVNSTPDQVYALQVSVKTSAPSTLYFGYYMAGVRGRLRVCFDYPANVDCPFDLKGYDVAEDGRKWKVGSVKVKEGDNTVTVIVDKLAKNYIIGLDEFRLIDDNSHGSLQC